MRPNTRRTRYAYFCRLVWRWLNLRWAGLQAAFEAFCLRNFAAPDPSLPSIAYPTMLEVHGHYERVMRVSGPTIAACVDAYLSRIEPDMTQLGRTIW